MEPIGVRETREEVPGCNHIRVILSIGECAVQYTLKDFVDFEHEKDVYQTPALETLMKMYLENKNGCRPV